MIKRIKCIFISLFFSTVIYANVITSIYFQNNHKDYINNINFSYSEFGIVEKYVNQKKEIIYEYKIKDYSENRILIEKKDDKNRKKYYEINIDNSSIQIVNDKHIERFEYQLNGDEIDIKGNVYQLCYSNSKLHFQTKNEDYIFLDSFFYDKKSYGKFFTSRNVRDVYRVTDVQSDVVEITSFCPYENNTTGCFRYYKEDSYLYQSIEGNIPLLLRFINYYILMADNQYDIEIILPLFISEYKIASKQNRLLSIESSSFLVEGEKKYEAENLLTKDGLPWASGNGYGINDKIIMNIESEGNLELVLYNGFQSSEKANLYFMNSRVKIIKITDIDMNNSKVIWLKDGKEKQIIEVKDIIGEDIRTVRLELEILDVYKGSKYSDLCIQAILVE